jgi:hypothetical protein
MKRLYILTYCSLILAMSIFFFKKKRQSTAAAGQGLVIPITWLGQTVNPITPEADRRPADQTFLTFPEWFLVFSPEEQANYYEQHTSTSFPFMTHTSQLWKSYRIINRQIKSFPTNWGYHFMIWVIGVSTTVEYSAKAMYETLVGRLTDTKTPITDEDKFNAQYTSDYVAFIKDLPWYQFDYKKRLKTLWTETPKTGSNFFRKWERRYMLTSELLVKMVYGKLIGMGTKQVYGVAALNTAVVFEDDSLHYLPRYDRFAGAALEEAKKGHSFKEIAGNSYAIMLTVWLPTDFKGDFAETKPIFVQRIPTQEGMMRVALVTTVPVLHKVLLELDKEKVMVEHVFDY